MNEHDFATASAGFSTAYLLAIVLVWIVMAVVAGIVAPEDRSTTFVLLTLLLGPLGVAAAAIAQPREHAYSTHVNVTPPTRPIAAGRRRFICPRCGAENDIPEDETSYECWQCSEHLSRVNLKPKTTRSAASPKEEFDRIRNLGVDESPKQRFDRMRRELGE
jgi:DNA-directed RNA polymerase subunit RPC12/RpoP